MMIQLRLLPVRSLFLNECVLACVLVPAWDVIHVCLRVLMCVCLCVLICCVHACVVMFCVCMWVRLFLEVDGGF